MVRQGLRKESLFFSYCQEKEVQGNLAQMIDSYFALGLKYSAVYRYDVFSLDSLRF